jgi:hypothetical protein
MRSSTAGVDPTVSATGWAADHRGDRARDGFPASCRSSGDAAAHVGKLHDDDVCHNVLGLYAVESEAGAVFIALALGAIAYGITQWLSSR